MKRIEILFLGSLLISSIAFSQSKSLKRGICGDASPADLAAMSEYISWYYDWGVEPPAVSNNQLSGIEWVPMQWGGISESQVENIKSRIPEGSLYLLGFNEPNFRSQANLTPQKAAEMWPFMEQIATEKGLKLVSPAVNWCGDCVDGVTYDPTDWLDKFIAACPDCNFDYIAIHNYAPYSAALKSYIEMFRKYNKPIWITEFAPWDAPKPDYAGVVQYMKETIPILEAEPLVFRYSWFATRVNSNHDIDLLGADGELTKLGKLYTTMPFDGSSTENVDPIVFLPAEQSINLPTNKIMLPGNVYYPSEEAINITWSQISGPNSATFTNTSIAKPTVSGLILGTYIFQLLAVADGKTDSAQITITVNGSNIAKNKSAKSSSNQNGNPAANVNDGNLSTRWSSLDADPQWIEIDLEGVFEITGAKIEWEAAFAKVYSIDVSDDGDTWKTVFSTSTGNGGTSSYTFTDTAQFIRMYSVQRNVQEQWWGNSIWEFEVYGSEIETSSISNPSQGSSFNLYPNPCSNGLISIEISSSQQLTAKHCSVFDVLGNSIYEKVIPANVTSYQINLNKKNIVKNGLYFISIEDNKGINTQKFIIK